MRFLNIEDSERDSALLGRELGRGFPGSSMTRVETAEDFAAALDAGPWDFIIADHSLPRFSSLAALAMLRTSRLDIPLIVISGTMGLGFVVEAMRAGARDYLVKSDLVRLNSVVEREVRDAATRRLAASRHALAGDVVGLLNGTGVFRSHLREVLDRVAAHAGADAGGIRLRRADDFPYFTHFGFSAGFLAAEDSLHVGAGCEATGCDAGPGSLECLCGAVVRGTEALRGCATSMGSFVTGRLAESTRPRGPLGDGLHLRGRCAMEGFQSLALVPLRSEDEIVGLLQLNAREADRFDPGLVTFLEELAPGLGLAVDRRRAQEALRVTEERYRVLVEASPNGVALTALDSTVVMANRRLARLLGVADAAELVGRRLAGFVAEEDRPRAEAELVALVAGATSREGPLRFRHGDASFDAEISAGLTSRDSGTPALVLIIRDVTQQRRLQARLAQSDRMASIGMLAAGVAHEINNPLTYVLYNLESLAADLPAAEPTPTAGEEPLELEKRAREALEGARRIREIVKDLKVFSRAGDERLEAVSLNKVIEGAVNMTQNEVKYRARLVASYGALPPVRANEGRLAQVFLNLLVNAAQAIREGDVERNTISVRTWRDGESVVAEVKDTGAGMALEVQRRVFEPFFTTKPAGIGTGLGLAITREIVEEAGGSIAVQSEPGAGATFVVRLPMASDPVPVAPPPRDSAPKHPSTRRGRILLVDDEAFVRSAVTRLLRGEHDVVQASSGFDAETILADDERFDVILTDLLMPEVSGMELYEGLLAARPELASRVIFMTGGVFTQRASEFLAAVPNTKLEKPVDTARLRELIAVMVAARDKA